MEKNKTAVCSFCGRAEDQVEKLVSGPNAFICDKCISICQNIIEKKPSTAEFKILKPKTLSWASR